MAVPEFELIARYFARDAAARDGEGVVLGIGDDAAILRAPPGEDLLFSIDTVVAGTHFPASMAPADIGYRALAVNLSDLAAMGARPLWFTLALTLPGSDEAWLAAFSEGLLGLARREGIVLVGGDTTRGPLSITIQVHGAVPRGSALRRDGARPGDEVWVSGWPGLAALGLRAMLAGYSGSEPAHRAFLAPEPRLALGRALRGVASAAIDVSDGLLADAGHIAERSGVRLVLDAAALPLASALTDAMDHDAAVSLCLGGGDDYELCFCAAPRQAAAIRELAARLSLPCTRIGHVEAGTGVSCLGAPPVVAGYQHFAEGT
jgi:thiamine-monophosphate kinase